MEQADPTPEMVIAAQVMLQHPSMPKEPVDGPPAWRRKCAAETRAAARRLLPRLRTIAREHGYALGLHGSVARDIDLIAAPWTDEAAEAEVLIQAFRLAIDPGGHFNPPHVFLPEAKPHGRLAWSIHMWGTYFDVSVMPKGPPTCAD